MKKYFIKFVPWNVNTITALLTKQVWFSKVYNFNDPYELPLVHYEVKKEYDNNKKIEHEFSEYFAEGRNVAAIVDKLLNKVSRPYDLSDYESYKKWLYEAIDIVIKKDHEKLINSEGRFACILDHILYERTGIFSMSSVDVFDDDSAILMFAHYADKWNGLALVFSDENNNATAIEYQKEKNTDCQKSSLLYAFEKDLHTKPFFLCKSEKWEYEKEYRIFGKPGLNGMKDVGLELVGIFYHKDKFQDTEILEIIKKHYNDGISIQSIYESQIKIEPYKLKTRANDQATTIKKYLKLE